MTTYRIPSADRASIRVTVIDESGAASPVSREVTVRPAVDIVTDRDDPSTLTFPDPAIVQEGPVVTITPRVPDGETDEEYEYEIRQSTSGGGADDAVHVGFTGAGMPISAPAWPEDFDIHYRPYRPHDGAQGAWGSVAVAVLDTVGDVVKDHDAGWGGTIEDTIATGVATMEISGGDLQFRVDITADELGTSSVSVDDLLAVSADQIGIAPHEGIYTAPITDTGASSAFQVLWKPGLGTITRPTPSVDDLLSEPVAREDVDTSGDYVDWRVRDSGFTADGDNYPQHVRAKIATSTAASPTFVDADFDWWVPGRVYYCRTYAMRFHFYSYGLTRWVWDHMRIWRWCAEHWLISCHRKAWSRIESEPTHGFAVGNVVMHDASNWVKADASAGSTMPAFGLVVNVTTDTFRVSTTGLVEWPSHGLTVGTEYYVSETAGTLTTTAPTGGALSQGFLIPVDVDTVYLLNHIPEST